MKNQEHNKIYLDHELILMLQQLSEELNRCPTVHDIDARSDLPDVSTFERRFDSWKDALREAGLESKHGRDDDSVIDEIVQHMIVNKGMLPTKEQCSRKNGLPAAQTLRNRFTSFGAAMARAASDYSKLVNSDDQANPEFL